MSHCRDSSTTATEELRKNIIFAARYPAHGLHKVNLHRAVPEVGCWMGYSDSHARSLSIVYYSSKHEEVMQTFAPKCPNSNLFWHCRLLLRISLQRGYRRSLLLGKYAPKLEQKTRFRKALQRDTLSPNVVRETTAVVIYYLVMQFVGSRAIQQTLTCTRQI